MPQRSEEVIDAIRRLAHDEIAASAEVVDRERSFPSASLKALADAGAFGLMIPEARAAPAAHSRLWSRRARRSERPVPRPEWSFSCTP